MFRLYFLSTQDLSKPLAEKGKANEQLQASLGLRDAELTKVKEVLASQEAARNEARQQLKSEPFPAFCFLW